MKRLRSCLEVLLDLKCNGGQITKPRHHHLRTQRAVRLSEDLTCALCIYGIDTCAADMHKSRTAVRT